VHIGSEKRLNPPRDLLGGFESQVHRILRGLAHPPEKGQRRLHKAADVLAPSMAKEMRAEWRIEDIVEGSLVQPSTNRLLLTGTLCLIPRRDLGFEPCTVRPTVEGLVAIGPLKPTD